MSTLLQTEDLSFLHGKQVDQVCIGLYQLQIRLSENVCISLEGNFHHKGHGSSSANMMEISTKGSTLLSLLGKTVERVMAGAGNALTLQFSDNEVLTIFIRGASYESLMITAPGKNIVA